LVPVVRPTVDSADPAFATGGDRIELFGQNLLETTSVKFDGVEARFRVDGPGSVFAFVPPRASGGPVEIILTTTGGTSDPLEFTYIDCSSANWVAGADLRGCDLAEQDLSSLNLAGADLTEALLDRASFEFADLTGAVLTRAVLENTILIDAILVGATLTDMEIISARMQAANLTEANLTGSDLTNAEFDSGTICSVPTYAVTTS
jgi:hypothetical protein